MFQPQDTSKVSSCRALLNIEKFPITKMQQELQGLAKPAILNVCAHTLNIP
jgi:hypothetical protein